MYRQYSAKRTKTQSVAESDESNNYKFLESPFSVCYILIKESSTKKGKQHLKRY